MDKQKRLLSRRQIATGYVFAITAALCFSVKAVLIKLAYSRHPDVEPITLLALRMLWSLPFFSAAALVAMRHDYATKLSKQDRVHIIALGVLGYYVSSWLDFSGLQYISAGMERMILFTYPTVVVLLTAYLEKRSVRREEIIALVLTYSGLLLVFIPQIKSNEPKWVIGTLFVFAAAVTFAFFTVVSVNLILRLGAFRFTAYTMTTASCATAIHFLIADWETMLGIHNEVILFGAVLALVSTVIPVFLASLGLHALGANRAAIINSVSPVATLILAYFILGETLSTVQWGGALLVISGIVSIGVRKSE